MPADPSRTVLRLTVRNHPGVMSHVSGLFARRAFNVEGIICLPARDGLSVMLLEVADDDRLPQVMAQLRKLEDVRELRCDPAAARAFRAAAGWIA
jgi:acetolactate synthase-1/3 small subunit